MDWLDLALLAGAYLLGAIPNGWVIARLWKGIDIRDYGSGNVGASNVLRHVGKRAAVLVAVCDILKGFIPPIAAIALNRPLEIAMLAGLIAIVGHDWSIFLRFSGGRGVATVGGAMLALAVGVGEPIAFVAAVLVVFVGIAVHLAAPATLAAALLATVLTLFLPDPALLTTAWVGATLLLIIKRLLGNPPRPGLPTPPITPGVLWNRLIYDRDLRDADAWINRHPLGPGEDANTELGQPQAR